MPPKKVSELEEQLKELISGIETRQECRFNELKSDILAIKDTVIKRLLDDNLRLKNRVKDLETEVYKGQQYNRRNNIEINGIPDSITNESLENKVIEALAIIDVKVTESDIEACHRLPSKTSPRPTIIKFVNRKNCEKILRNKKKLATRDTKALGFTSKLYIQENMCPYYKYLAWKCRRLKEANLIYSSWFYKGSVTFKVNENDKDLIKVTHEKEIDDMFPDFEYPN